jgi:hypothetical protein
VTEQKYAKKNNNELVIDHLPARRGNLLFENSKHFAKNTKGEGIAK